MRVLLRSQQTRLYLCADGRWASTPDQALNFGHSGQAVQYVFENRLPHMEVVLAFDDPAYDLSLPVSLGPPRARGEAGPGSNISYR